ncbi:MAG: hypothetical protein QOE27_2808 [Solirubrobacteraceae bacterium]|nr:hypothetical protein [Solirubrobacteraceae bacterium]
MANMVERALGGMAGLMLGAGLAGCGGGSAGRTAPPGAGHAAAGAPAAAVAVIRGWAEALARGDVVAAGAYFATPSRVQLDPREPVAVVRTAAEARSVNLMLPCGAKLLDARPVAGGYLDALFLLGRRPGAECGTGVGATGRVAFVIRSGKIAVWRRIPDEPGDANRSAPGGRPPGAPVGLPPATRSV